MAKDLTALNNGYLDTLLLAEDDSPFDYKGFYATSHYSQDHIDHDCENTLSKGFGETANIHIPFGEYHIGKVQLTFDVSAFTQSTGTYVRLPDFGAYHCIENITAKYGNNDLINPKMETDDMLLTYNLYNDLDERQHKDVNIAGNLSQAERNAKAAAVQHLLIELELPWTSSPDLYVNMNSLNKEIIFKVKFNTIAGSIETDATNASTDITATISNVKLRVFHYTQADKVLARQTARVKSQVNPQGILKKISYWEKLADVKIPTGVDYYDVDLKSIKGNVMFWVFWIRPRANVNPGAANQDRLTLVDIASWELFDGQNSLIRETEGRYNRYYLMPHWFPGVPGNYIFGHSNTMTPTNLLNSTGHLNHGAMKSPKLRIKFNGALGSEHRLDFWACSHQFMQHRDATLRVIFD
jgi:hypothetical protein